jgi:predicted nucleotidyltransferase
MSILDRLREGATALPAVQLAVLFGSAARGEERRRSDLDVGVLLDPNTAASRAQAQAALDRAAGGREVDVVSLDEAPPLLRFEIARDGVLLVEREPGLWTHFKARAMVDWWDWAPTARKIHRAAIQRLRGEPVTW